MNISLTFLLLYFRSVSSPDDEIGQDSRVEEVFLSPLFFLLRSILIADPIFSHSPYVINDVTTSRVSCRLVDPLSASSSAWKCKDLFESFAMHGRPQDPHEKIRILITNSP